jgi:hypothetical protein
MLALRLSGEDKEALDELVRRRAARLAEEGGAVTASSVIRALIRQAAAAEGIALTGDERPRKSRS